MFDRFDRLSGTGWGKMVGVSMASPKGNVGYVPKKRLHVSRLHKMGWKHRIGLREGFTSVYAEFAKSELAKA